MSYYYYYYRDEESIFTEDLKRILTDQQLADKEKVHSEYLLTQTDNARQYRADIYLDIESLSLKDEKGGSTEICGPIVFELKRQLQFDTVSRCLKMHKRLQPTARYQSFVLIYFNENHFSSTLQTSNLPSGFYVYNSRNFLKALGKKDGTQKPQRTEYEKKTEDWKVERSRILEKARADFNQGNDISLFLGAGVSMAAGLPGWNALLERMLSDANLPGHLDGKDLSQISGACGSSSIVLGRFIKAYHENHSRPDLSPKKFTDILHDALYKSFDNKTKSPLVTRLTELIKTGRVSEVITYNFDNILETYLDQENAAYYSVFDNNAPQQGLPIYHVHGFIPQNKEGIDTPMPVLSEEQYHEVYANAYNWGNIEQLHALNRTTCFFIGLSMNDPNLRRILEISHREADDRARHYVFLKRQTNFNTERKDKCFQYVQTEIFRSLGLNVIWYDNHNELPDLLEKLKK